MESSSLDEEVGKVGMGNVGYVGDVEVDGGGVLVWGWVGMNGNV